jgi:hypothetical protein
MIAHEGRSYQAGAAAASEKRTVGNWPLSCGHGGRCLLREVAGKGVMDLARIHDELNLLAAVEGPRLALRYLSKAVPSASGVTTRRRGLVGPSNLRPGQSAGSPRRCGRQP